MYCNYKIYYNNSFVLITCDRTQINKNFTRIYDNKTDIDNFLNDPAILFDNTTNDQILVICDKPGENMCNFLERMDIVVAGGGIVTNENNELLLIFRRGKWDMAKGKIELKEEIAQGALREVTEETGVKVELRTTKPIVTYHAYKMKGKQCLKETNWYPMRALPGQKNLVPQTEEDIEEARWVKPEDIEDYKQNSFPLIWDLISTYYSKAENAVGK